jgi:hypothetical protein
LQECREVLQIGGRRARRVAVEPGDTILDIGRVADLRHLAVRHKVDPAGDLPRDAGVDRLADHRVELRLIDRFSAFLRENEIGDRAAAGQRADMGGEDAVRHDIDDEAGTRDQGGCGRSEVDDRPHQVLDRA